jgi:arylsulfatase A-like enzyme
MDFYMREAERVLDERHPDKPLFLYFAHQQLHIPLEGPREPEYAEECSKHIKITDPDGLNRHTLCTMMNRLDRSVGDFEQMLKDRGLWEDTLLWVTTDNGGMTQYAPDFPGSASSNFPLRGGKTTLFEGGVRGVSFLTGGLLPASASGKEYSGLLQHVDIPATMARLAGAELEADGLDVWSAITSGAPSPRTEVPLNVDVSTLAKLCTMISKLPNEPTVPEVGRRLSDASLLSRQNYSALIQGDWKLINGYSGFYDGYWSNGPYLRTEADFYTQGPVKMGGDSVWLFDLQNDPEERRNVAATNPSVVAQLQARLLELADPATGYRDPQNNVPSLRAQPSLHNGTWAPWKRSKAMEALV